MRVISLSISISIYLSIYLSIYYLYILRLVAFPSYVSALYIVENHLIIHAYYHQHYYIYIYIYICIYLSIYLLLLHAFVALRSLQYVSALYIAQTLYHSCIQSSASSLRNIHNYIYIDSLLQSTYNIYILLLLPLNILPVFLYVCTSEMYVNMQREESHTYNDVHQYIQS
jgi:hypothetical protein